MEVRNCEREIDMEIDEHASTGIGIKKCGSFQTEGSRSPAHQDSCMMNFFTSLARVSLIAAQGITAAQITYNWTIDWVNNVNPDGLYSRRAIGVNGQYPPPLIVCRT